MATGLGAITDAQAFGSQMAYKTLAFTGAATLGLQNSPCPLFTVTGAVIALVIGVCTETIVGGGASVEVGTNATSGGIIATTAIAAPINIGMIWVDASPALLEVWTTGFGSMIGDGADIELLPTGANVTDGTFVFTCFWTPLSGDAYVIAV